MMKKILAMVALFALGAATSASAAMNKNGYFPPAKGAKLGHNNINKGKAAHQAVKTVHSGKHSNDFSNLNH